MQQVTLTEDNFKILQQVVQFAIEDLEETQGAAPQGRLWPSDSKSATYEDCLNLESAIEHCTRRVDA